MGKKGVLFDLDGVLLDSEGTYYEFWDSIAREYKVGVPNFAYAIKGTNMTSILSHFTKEEQAEIIQKHTDFQNKMKFSFFPGAIDFVKRLAEKGIPRCVVTSSEEAKMSQLYGQHPYFPALFDAIITGDMVEHGKPNPECFLKGAAAIHCDIKDCYVFEDSIQGSQAGLAAGATVVGLCTTYPMDKVAQLAHKVLPSLSCATEDIIS